MKHFSLQGFKTAPAQATGSSFVECSQVSFAGHSLTGHRSHQNQKALSNARNVRIAQDFEELYRCFQETNLSWSVLLCKFNENFLGICVLNGLKCSFQTLEERISRKNCKFLWPGLLRTCIKLQSIHCVGQKKRLRFELDRKLNPRLKFQPNFLTWLPNGKWKRPQFIRYFPHLFNFQQQKSDESSHAKLMINWLQWLEKRWGDHARWWAITIFQCFQCARARARANDAIKQGDDLKDYPMLRTSCFIVPKNSCVLVTQSQVIWAKFYGIHISY